MEYSVTSSLVSLDAVERLRAEIADLFEVYDTTLDQPERGHVRYRGHFLQDPADSFPELRRRFERYGFTPLVRDEDDRVALIGMPGIFASSPSNVWINVALLIATILSTLLVGAMYAGETTDFVDLLRPSVLIQGWPFSLSIMLILGAHEMGHYFAARYHNVPVTEPYFIPMPLSIIGTMGAFIRLKGPVTNRRALLDVGAAGPLAGLLFAVPILIYGLYTSSIGPLPTGGGYVLEGNSLLYIVLKWAVYGQYLPANGLDVQLNQVAWAGWVGLLVTGLNLIPVGQLDGGHVSYVLFGERARAFFWPAILLLGGLVVLTGATTWIIWILLLFVFGRVYAQPLDDVTELDPRRRAIAIFTLLLFFLVFTPIPLRVIS